MLVYSMSVSVDGFIADRDGGWSVPSDDLFRFLVRTRELGGFLWGRRLYETMPVWETEGNARLAKASSPRRQRRRSTRPTRTSGSGGAGLAAAAIEVGLVDEVRMFRNPVVVGGGTQFLPPVTEHIALNLIESTTCESRVIYERYRRAR